MFTNQIAQATSQLDQAGFTESQQHALQNLLGNCMANLNHRGQVIIGGGDTPQVVINGPDGGINIGGVAVVARSVAKYSTSTTQAIAAGAALTAVDFGTTRTGPDISSFLALSGSTLFTFQKEAKCRVSVGITGARNAATGSINVLWQVISTISGSAAVQNSHVNALAADLQDHGFNFAAEYFEVEQGDTFQVKCAEIDGNDGIDLGQRHVTFEFWE